MCGDSGLLQVCGGCGLLWMCGGCGGLIVAVGGQNIAKILHCSKHYMYTYLSKDLFLLLENQHLSKKC